MNVKKKCFWIGNVKEQEDVIEFIEDKDREIIDIKTFPTESYSEGIWIISYKENTQEENQKPRFDFAKANKLQRD